MNEERIVRRATRRKAIKKEGSGRERKKKKYKRGEKEKRVESQDMDDRGDTRLFHKVYQRVLAIVNHHFQSSALVYNIYIYCWHSYSSAHTSLSRGLRNTISPPPVFIIIIMWVSLSFGSFEFTDSVLLVCAENKTKNKSSSSSITGSEREEPPTGFFFFSLNQSLIYTVDVYIPPAVD